MDPLTQGLLGASFGQAIHGRTLGKRALVVGALVGMAPDLDVVMRATGPMGEWLWHRGPTHSLWFGPVFGPALGWALWRWKGGRLDAWIGLAVVALFTHPLLDLFTSYGTQLLSPLSSRRFALDAIGIIDPAYSLVLAVALAYGRLRGPGTAEARTAAWTALGITTAYLGLGLVLNERAEARAAAQLRVEGLKDAQVDAYPTLLQLPLRRLVARSGSEVRVGWTSLLAPEAIDWERFEDAAHPLAQAARATDEGRILEWFADGQTVAAVTESPEGTVVEIDDLRYGLPGSPRLGLWGLRFRFDRQGRPLEPGTRVDRDLPAGPGHLLAEIVRRTFGWS